MHHSRPAAAAIAAVLIALAACSQQDRAGAAVEQAEEGRAAASASMDVAAVPAAPPAPDVQSAGVEATQMASSANSAVDPQRRFVRTANARFQVRDVYAATLQIEDAVGAAGGFVVSNRVESHPLRHIDRPIGEARRLRLTEMQTQGSLLVRVPSERTAAFLRTIAKHAEFLDARTFEANDVQFEVLRRQLAYLRAQQVQDDVARAGAQPGGTGAKVDAATVRADMLAQRDEAQVAQRELEDRIAFSTLSFELQQPVQVREQVMPDTSAILRERGPGFFAELGEALRSGWRGLLVGVLAFARLWPLWLLAGTGVALLGTWRTRRGRVVPTA